METNENENAHKSCKNCKHVLRLIAVGFGWRCSILESTIPHTQICDKHEPKETTE